MGTSPINNQNNSASTGQLRRTGQLDPAVADGALAAAAQNPPTAPARTRDTAKTGPLDPTAVPPTVNLEQIQVPPAPAPAPAPKKEGFFGSLWDGVKNVGRKAEQVAEAVVHDAETAGKVAADVIASGAAGVENGLAHGDGTVGALKDGLHAAERTAYSEAADPLMTQAIGKADKADDKAAGALGPILTDRLPVGGSVDIKIEAGATLPTELVGAPNVKLDGGGMLKIKRVEARDANDKPILGAAGKPETRLEVELQAYGRAGAAYSAKVGLNETVSVAGHEAGIQGGARASAEAGFTGSLDIKLRFNPNDPTDMGDLLAMTKATAATGAAVALPGIGAVFAGMSVGDYKRSMDSLGSHLESVGGEGGIYAQVSASAKLGVGIFKGQGSADANGQDKPGLVGRLANQGLDNAHTAVLEKLNLNAFNVGASLGGSGSVGVVHNFRTGETTYTVSVNGSANASGAVLGAGDKVGASANRKVNLIVGPDGKLKDVTVTQSMTTEHFKGMMTTVQDMFGRPLDPGVVAGIGKSDTVTVNYRLKPAIVNQIRGAHDLGAIANAAVAVSSAAITEDRFKLDVGDIVTDHRDQFDFHFDLGAALGAEVDMRGGIVLGHDQEHVIS